MMPFPVTAAAPGRTGAAGFLLPAPGTPAASGQPGFVPGLAVPGLAWPAGPGGT
jgi:hypothetical protein